MTNDSISDTVSELRATFEGRKTHPYAWRLAQLEQLKAMTIENESEIFDALEADLGKSNFETYLSETSVSLTEIGHTIKHLKKWMKPQRVSTPMSNQPGRSEIVHEPLGVVLIIAPWNYPFYLIVSPLIGAIAAGNCAVLKPSELTPKTSAVLAKCVAKYLDQDAVRIVEGGADVASGLLMHRFDHIFFTGSPRIGKVVMAAAAKHLTPVTLELGGKSPCLVNEDADLDVAAKRIAWGKYLNAGQTCVAPDYVLVHQRIAGEFGECLKAAVHGFYGDAPRASPDFPRIVNEQHFKRIAALMESGEVLYGGGTDRAERYIEPTALTNVSPASPIMNEEIFGPILPILPVTDIDEAIAFVNERQKPLALYLFSNDDGVRDQVVDQTSSGGVCINDVVMHLVIPNLPFGGVGPSGMGAYHGRVSFETFSHAKGVLAKSEHFEVPLRYPPYTKPKFKWLRRLL